LHYAHKLATFFIAARLNTPTYYASIFDAGIPEDSYKLYKGQTLVCGLWLMAAL